MPIVLPTMSPCYFCEMAEGRGLRWQVIERTPLTMTVLNGRQYETGQAMVVPLRHAPTLLELTAEEDAAIMAASRRLARAMTAAFDPDGLLVYQNNGVGSGQEVPHFHLHVVPRRAGSDWGLGPPHLARLERRPPQFDHAVTTAAKQQAAEILRRLLL